MKHLKEMYDQMSLFDQPESSIKAVCCMNGEERPITILESWMKRLVPAGKYAVKVAEYLLVLFPAKVKTEDIEQGQLFHYYTVDGKLYDGIFVGR